MNYFLFYSFRSHFSSRRIIFRWHMFSCGGAIVCRLRRRIHTVSLFHNRDAQKTMDSYAFERWECERTQYNFIHGRWVWWWRRWWSRNVPTLFASTKLWDRENHFLFPFLDRNVWREREGEKKWKKDTKRQALPCAKYTTHLHTCRAVSAQSHRATQQYTHA